MVWWRRWSGSIARRASARLAARLRSSAGGMPASTGSCSTGVDCTHPVIVRRVQLRLTSNRLVCLLLFHVGAQYSACAYTSARAEVWSVDGLASHPVPTNLPRWGVVIWKFKRLVLMCTSKSRFASLLFKWKTVEIVLPSLSRHCLRYRAKVLMSRLRVLSIFFHSRWAVRMAKSYSHPQGHRSWVCVACFAAHRWSFKTSDELTSNRSSVLKSTELRFEVSSTMKCTMCLAGSIRRSFRVNPLCHTVS